MSRNSSSIAASVARSTRATIGVLKIIEQGRKIHRRARREVLETRRIKTRFSARQLKKDEARKHETTRTRTDSFSCNPLNVYWGFARNGEWVGWSDRKPRGSTEAKYYQHKNTRQAADLTS